MGRALHYDPDTNEVWLKIMTVCVAALADKGESLILVADRMVGIGVMSGQPDIRKGFRVHKDWWALLAGNESSASEVMRLLKQALPQGPLRLDEVRDHLAIAYQARREHEAEALHLLPHGYTTDSFFKDGRAALKKSVYRDIEAARASHRSGASLLVAGFDSAGDGHILSIEKNGKIENHDLSGYYAIGVGAYGAIFTMMEKDVSPRMSARAVAYYAVEGKYMAEKAPGVGEDTDLWVIRRGEKPVKMHWEAINRGIIRPICEKLEPKRLRKKDVKKLNRVKGLKRLPKAKW